MTTRFLLATVSLIALPLGILASSTPARADCAWYDAGCQASRLGYFVTHLGNETPPAATLTTAPAAPAAPVVAAAPAGPSQADINKARIDITNLAIVGIISKDMADQATAKLVSAGGGNIVSAGGGNIVSAGGGNVISNDGGSILAANALALIPAAGNLKAQIASALVSSGGGNIVSAGGGNIVSAGGGNLQQRANAIIQTNANIAAGMQQAGLINGAQVIALNQLVAAGGGNIVSAGGGNIVSAGGGNIVSAGGGNLVGPSGGTMVSTNGGNIVSAGGGNIVSAGGGNLVAAGGGNFTLSTAAASIVSAGGGNIVSAGGGNLVSAGGGNLVSAGGGNLVSAGGGNLVSAGGGNLVSAGGGNLLSTASGSLVSAGGGNLVSAGGGNLVSAGGGNLQVANINSLLAGSGDKLIGAALVTAGGRGTMDLSDKGAAVANVLTATLVGQKAMTDVQNASQALTNASAQVKSDAQGLSDALKKYGTNDQTGTVKQFQDSLDKHEAALKPLAVDLAIKVTLVPATDPAAVKTLQDLASKAGTAVKQNVDAANTIHDVAVRDAVAAATGPTAQDRAAAAAATAAATAAFNTAQVAAANAQSVASAADAAYKTVSQGVIRPADAVSRVGVDLVGADNVVGTLKAKSDATQALLAAANKGNPPMSTNDLNLLRTQAVSDSKAYFYQKDMADNGYAEKYARANFSDENLTSAKAAVATLTALPKPTDPAALATLNKAIAAATTVQQASQAKSDQLYADARIVQLQASNRDGANVTDAQKDQNRAEITRLQGVSAASTATLATIVQTNPANPALAAVAANNFGSLKTTDFDYSATKTGGPIKQVSGAPVPVPVVAALTSAVVIPALAQVSQSATAAVQTANAAVQTAGAAVQQASAANLGSGQFKQVSTITSNSNFDVTQIVAVLDKAGASLKDKQVASLAPTAGGSTAAPATGVVVAQPGAPASNTSGASAVVATAPTTPTSPGTATPVVSDPVAQANLAKAGILDSNIRQATAALDSKTQALGRLETSLASAPTGDQASIKAAIAATKSDIANIQSARDADSKQAADLKGTAVAAVNPKPAAPVAVLAPPPVVAAAPAPITAPAAGPIDPVAKVLAGEPGLYEKVIAMKLPPEVMKQLATGTFGTGPVATEISKLLIQARTEIAAAKAATPAPAAQPPVVVANAPPPGLAPQLENGQLKGEGKPVTGGPVLLQPAKEIVRGGELKTGGPAQPVTLDPKLIAPLLRALRTVPIDHLTTDQKYTLSELDRILKVAAKGPLTGKDAEGFSEHALKLAIMHPDADKKLGLTALAKTAAPAPAPAIATAPAASPATTTTVALPSGAAGPASKEALIQRELSPSGRDSGARKADYLPERVTIVPPAAKSDEPSKQVMPALKLEAKKTDDVIVKPAGAVPGGVAAPTAAADKTKLHEAPKQAIVPTAAKSAAVEPVHAQPVTAVKPAAAVQVTPKVLAPQVTAPKVPQPTLAAAKPLAAPPPPKACTTPNMQMMNGHMTQVGTRC